MTLENGLLILTKEKNSKQSEHPNCPICKKPS